MPRAPTASDLAPLLAWYRSERREMPWRRTRDPYAIWLSETMLQQTRVETVIPYYERFLRALPTVASLAEAPSEQVLALWSGLGYYRRARMLKAAAERVVREHGGRIPSSIEGLRTLEGVGAYTAGAVASIAFGVRAPLVDGNVARVFARLFAIEDDVKSAPVLARMWAVAEELVAAVPGEPGDWNQALMELGATVCTPRSPRCERCPVAGVCLARARGLQEALPKVREKAAVRVVPRVAVVLASSSAVLLARRRPGALFGGLWEPPMLDGPPATLKALAGALGVAPEGLRSVGVVEHVLSHRRLRVKVFRGELGRRRRWPVPGADYDAAEVVPLAEVASRAHSTLARKVLAGAESGQGRRRRSTIAG